jgi:putative Ca2+/H+ antiporter (TMEM165/GDT1 family)
LEAALEPFLIATGIVGLAEIGDKTQLLAFVLAARFRKPLPIILGVLIATLLNHAFAGAVGTVVHSVVSTETLRWLLGASFVAMAIWILIPDKLDKADIKPAHFGIVGTTALTFFFAEMADKTQIATIALSAQYQAIFAVVIGTTLGMMLANVPAVMLGDRLAHRLRVRLIHGIAAAIFAALAVAILTGAGSLLGLGL